MPMPRASRIAAAAAAALLLLFALLCIPAPAPVPAPAPARGAPFAWDRDAYWRSLEGRFAAARSAGCAASAPAIARDLDALSRGVDALGARAYPPQSAVYDSLQGAAFDAAALIAACPAREGDLVRVSERLRDAVKAQSRRWDPASAEARARLYTLLYGTRAAVEAVMVRAHDGAFALVAGSDAPSATPAAAVRGVTVHSGDLLLSRGGYPTSALIARGSDFPGEFSHVALVHVDSATHAVSVVEAHIERGVAVSTVEQYLGDAKLRILLLRPRADLPALVRDPMLPHRAAGDMLARARREHIPYDFTMDQRDPEALFCSEVASAAYGGRGVGLWPGLSTISAPGLRRWLAEFGVTHFETEEPSDLEYDPQLVVVAEWRDPSALLRGQIDDAVVDAMLERANAGWDIPYPWWQVPLARLAKGWSAVLNAFGKVGPVPEGMSASGALRQKAFMRVQRETAARVTALANDVRARTGAPPPYWVLLALARASVDAPVSP